MRNISIQVARIVAALLVIGAHVNLFGEYGSTASFLFKQGLHRIAVPLFFVISGYYLYSNLETRGKSYFKKYVGRIITISLIWGVIYMALFSVDYYRELDCSLPIKFLKGGANLFLAGGYMHLWYLPALVFSSIGLFFAWKLNKTGLTMILCALLYVTGCFLDRYYLFFDNPQWFLQLRNLLGYVLTSPARNFLFFGFPLMYLGAMMSKYTHSISKNNYGIWMCIIALLVFFIEFIGINFWFGNTRSGSTLYLTLPIVMFVIVNYLLRDPFKKLNNYLPAFFITTDLSLGVYLIHYLIINIFEHYQLQFNSILLLFIVFFISLGITASLKLIFKGKSINNYF